jgi:hypothetical protein
MFSLREAVITQNPSWDNTEAALWSVVELNTSILCSCLPTLRPILARIIPGLSSSHLEGSGSGGYRKQNYGYGASSRLVSTRNHPGAINTSRVAGTTISKASPRSISTEELALSDIESQKKSLGDPTGVYASCSADDHRSDDFNVAMPRNTEKGRILVTMETSIRASPGSDRY